MSDPSSPARISEVEYTSRLRALLRRGGLANGLPRRRRDAWIVLHAIAEQFAPDERLSEIDATRRIGGFLGSYATHWRIDRVTLRRALIDEGFLDRESSGTDYRRSERHRARVEFDAVPAVDAVLAPAGEATASDPHPLA